MEDENGLNEIQKVNILYNDLLKDEKSLNLEISELNLKLCNISDFISNNLKCDNNIQVLKVIGKCKNVIREKIEIKKTALSVIQSNRQFLINENFDFEN
jgi:hypothetical protein